MNDIWSDILHFSCCVSADVPHETCTAYVNRSLLGEVEFVHILFHTPLHTCNMHNTLLIHSHILSLSLFTSLPSLPFLSVFSYLSYYHPSQDRVEVNGARLKISNLALEDSGMYQCVAENKHGTIYSTAELRVQGTFQKIHFSIQSYILH